MNEYERPSLFCNTCGEKTEHIVLARHAWPDDKSSRPENEQNLLECGSCHSPLLRWARNEPPENFERYFPPTNRFFLPAWSLHLPTVLREMLSETYAGFNAELYWLSAMGLRSLIDAFALQAVGDIGGFKATMTKLQSEGYLSKRDVLSLEAAIELGHDATHRSKLPDSESCVLAFRIVEHLLQRFAIEQDASNLQARRSGIPGEKLA